ncbi:hypothetical protein ACFOD4_17120 [Pseudoroseomonas globiformis]|uniref:Uncharacterized protein n=1 Tax=Teichococcus globiformis TaxID=2307229 RepID=A0ABV7G5G3_9PROT
MMRLSFCGTAVRAGLVESLRRDDGSGKGVCGGLAMRNGVTKRGGTALNLAPMTDTSPTRRIVPQTGPHLWSGATLSPSDWMLPLGAEAGTEIEAALADPAHPMPRLTPLLSEVADRLAHGMGFCLMRGLPQLADPEALLRLLGSRIGAPIALPPSQGALHAEPCDALLLLCCARAEMALESAAARHNALMKSDRAALEALYRPLPQREGPDRPVFVLHHGVFAARLDETAAAAEAAAALTALRATADPALPLRITLHPGDLLAVNPFLVWAGRQEGFTTLALRMEPTRLMGPFAVPAEDTR